MKVFALILVAIFVTAIAGLLVWRQVDRLNDRAEVKRLRALQPDAPARFSENMVADLPEPARRFFRFAIIEGTPLSTVAEIEMNGRFSLGDKDAPNYVDMTAQQVLAAPAGFVWQMSGGTGLMRVSGSDSGRWTRFWVAGLAPVARFGGNADHTRSAFGRYAAETAFWTPAAILPGPNVTWEAVEENTARFIMRHDGQEQAVDISVDAKGRPVQVQLSRWTNANPDDEFRLQAFGGFLSGYQEFDGFRLPTHVEAGNFFGTDNYFPFFIVDVTSVRFPIRAAD